MTSTHLSRVLSPIPPLTLSVFAVRRVAEAPVGVIGVTPVAAFLPPWSTSDRQYHPTVKTSSARTRPRLRRRARPARLPFGLLHGGLPLLDDVLREIGDSLGLVHAQLAHC